MRLGRWAKGLVILVLLHLPVVAAALYYLNASKSRAATPVGVGQATAAALPAVPPIAVAPSAAPAVLLQPAPLAPAARYIVPLTQVAQTVPLAPLSEREAAMAIAAQQAAAVPAEPTPREQGAAGKEFIEGHWLGLETIPLTPELAKEYGIAPDETGILVDEISLESAESGILAGDLVHAVEGQLTPDLRAFFKATFTVRQRSEARVEVLRKGRPMTYTIRAVNAPVLGIAQMEAAQPILPGAISPHRTRSRPCTDCHIIMSTGGQLPTDQGDILPVPPVISRGAVAPHRYRGPCNTCHRILP